MDIVSAGLNQLDTEGLKELRAYLKAGKPLCLKGPVLDVNHNP